MVEVLHPATIYAASSSQIVDLPLGVNMSVKNIGVSRKKQMKPAKRWWWLEGSAEELERESMDG